MRAFLAVLLLVALVAPAPAMAQGSVLDLDIQVDGENAHGLVARPTGEPLGLVVILHGYGHQAESHRGHLTHIADQGWVGVAMDFRGPVDGFPLMNGALDTQAALLTLQAEPGLAGKPAYLYSVSMGTAVAALLLPMMPDTFTYWVDNEGLASLAETWAEATAVAPAIEFGAVASAAIERETGGTPITAPLAYVARSAVLRAAEFSGLQGAILTHGLNDGLVPYDQGRAMAGALRATGVPTAFYTVATCTPGSEGTTITGHAGLGGQGACGHGTESLDSHTLTKLSFELLDELLAGGVPADSDHVVDGTLGTLP